MVQPVFESVQAVLDRLLTAWQSFAGRTTGAHMAIMSGVLAFEPGPVTACDPPVLQERRGVEQLVL